MTETFTILPGDKLFPAATPCTTCSRCGSPNGEPVVISATWPQTGETEARYCAKCAGSQG